MNPDRSPLLSRLTGQCSRMWPDNYIDVSAYPDPIYRSLLLRSDMDLQKQTKITEVRRETADEN